MPPTQMVRALTLLYEAAGGDAWRNNSNWLIGEPCVDGWFGVFCCPASLPILVELADGTDACTSDGSQAIGPLATQGSSLCHSGNVTGTALDLATCVVVKVILTSNNLAGSLDVVDSLTSERALCGMPFLQHLDLSMNALVGNLPAVAGCLPRLTSLDLTHAQTELGGFAGRVPEWLLSRLESLATLHLANNAFDDPTTAVSAVAIRRLWQRCSAIGAEQCSGVPPFGCSAFNRPGQRYEVELTGLECVRCPSASEILGLAGIMAGIVLAFVLFVGAYTLFVRTFPEYAKTHIASFMILVSHLQTLGIIGSMQLGWPLVIQEILASINLPLMGYIPLPCILTDPVLKSLLNYMETGTVLTLLVGVWLVARRRRDENSLSRTEAWAEYFLSVLFSLLFTVGLRASATLFVSSFAEENLARKVIACLVSLLILPGFLLFLLLRFRRLLREARKAVDEVATAAEADAKKKVEVRQKQRRAAEAVRYLTERYASDDLVGAGTSTQASKTSDELVKVAVKRRERLPLRSQWQLIVWTRQWLLVITSFALDCFMWFSYDYDAHYTVRYLFASIAIVILCSFWWLQYKRQPYALRRQHGLESLLFLVDILAIACACIYGELTRDGQIQDARGRVALEILLAILLGAFTLAAVLFVISDYARDRWYVQQYYLKHGLVQETGGGRAVDSRQIIDAPIQAAICDGAVRIIDCTWLLDRANSDPDLPCVTRVEARLAVTSEETKKDLVKRLAKHCGTSSVCITVHNRAFSPASPPPSPPAPLDEESIDPATAPRIVAGATVRVQRSSGIEMEAKVLRYLPEKAMYEVELANGQMKHCREQSMTLITVEPSPEASQTTTQQVRQMPEASKTTAQQVRHNAPSREVTIRDQNVGMHPDERIRGQAMSRSRTSTALPSAVALPSVMDRIAQWSDRARQKVQEMQQALVSTFTASTFTLSDQRLGIGLSDEADGAVIHRLEPGSQAEALGVTIGGKITTVNGEAAATNITDLNAQLMSATRPTTLLVVPPDVSA